MENTPLYVIFKCYIQKTKSIIPAMLFHIMNNMLAFLG
ncbi:MULTISPECIES: hypothetical protein [Bacillus cereus group]